MSTRIFETEQNRDSTISSSSSSDLKHDDDAKQIVKTDTDDLGGELPDPATTDNRSREEMLKWSTKKSLGIWLLICYATGPVSSMSRSYVPAAIQSAANKLGHLEGSNKPCPRRGNTRCLVKFGAGEIDYNSYILYIKAISTAVEGVLGIFTTGIADYSNYKKSIMVGTVFLYGCSALPFAGLYHGTYSQLTGMACLYALMQCIDSIYQITEGSFIPILMRSRAAIRIKGSDPEQIKRRQVMNQGSLVSVLGIVIGNIGGITAALIGVIINYSWGSYVKIGYQKFLLAITIAGCLTIVAICFGAYFFPSVKGLKKPPNANLLTMSVKRYITLLKGIRNYPEAWKLCVGWVIWNVSYSNFLSIFMLLFRQELGIGSSDGEYTVWNFMTFISATLGSVSWLLAYPRTPIKIKQWAIMFLIFSVFANFWGCLGISKNTKVGYKHRAEFWIFEILYAGSSSALRSLNRTLYSSMLPEGSEAQYFGLEITMGVSVGWIGSLVNGSIQDRTGNLRWPMVPNIFLVLIALGLYCWVDTEKGMIDAEKLDEDAQYTIEAERQEHSTQPQQQYLEPEDKVSKQEIK